MDIKKENKIATDNIWKQAHPRAVAEALSRATKNA